MLKESNRRAYHTDLFIGCSTEEEKEDRRRILDSSAAICEVLEQIVKRRGIASGRCKLSDYDTPSWQYKLAHTQGQLEEQEYLLTILRPITNKIL